MNFVKDVFLILARMSVVALCVSTIYFEMMDNVISNERAETEKMILRSQLQQAAVSFHTNKLVLGMYYKDNAPQEEIYAYICNLHEMLNSLEQKHAEPPK